jgi:MFS family permease
LWRAVVYVLRVRSNLVFIVAGALGYFFLAGVRTFALLYIRGRYDLAQSTATLLVLAIGAGSVVGVVIGGRLGDRLIAHGRLAGRVVVAAAGYVAAAIILGPAIATGILGVSLPLYVLAGVALAAPNPPLDAARLDVIHHRVWGRAEGVRQFLRALAESGAPLLFGFTADHLLGGGSRGLEYAFLIMLVPLLASGALLFLTRGSYMRDVASAVESERRAA